MVQGVLGQLYCRSTSAGRHVKPGLFLTAEAYFVQFWWFPASFLSAPVRFVTEQSKFSFLYISSTSIMSTFSALLMELRELYAAKVAVLLAP